MPPLSGQLTARKIMLNHTRRTSPGSHDYDNFHMTFLTLSWVTTWSADFLWNHDFAIHAFFSSGRSPLPYRIYTFAYVYGLELLLGPMRFRGETPCQTRIENSDHLSALTIHTTPWQYLWTVFLFYPYRGGLAR